MRKSFRCGFTLVELLVVIAIIGILVALLLPAIQAAREAARRSECANNCKQIGIALHNFHDTYGRFPPGGSDDRRPFGTYTGGGNHWGPSWIAHILPFMEQKTVYEELDFANGSSGWGNTTCGAAISNVKIEALRCPSSPLEEIVPSPPPGNQGNVQLVTYVGISGAVDGLIPNYVETRTNNGGSATNCCSGGIASGSGVLFPFSQMKFSNITDGTSNVAAVGEQGDFLFSQDGSRQYWGTGHLHGWLIGAHGDGNNRKPPNYFPNGDARTFNQTTVRYAINQKTGWPNGSGNCASLGVCQNVGNNIPLNSAHPGGVHVVLCDGSVRLVNDSVTLSVLGKLVTRDDGVPLEQF